MPPLASPQFNARLDIVNARFLVRQLPYPISLVHGSLVLARDPVSGKDFLTLTDVQGSGVAGGPNEHFDLVVNGRVGPIGPDSPEPGIDLHAAGMNFNSDPALAAVLPPDIHDAMVLFDARHEGIYPKFKVNFAADIHKDPGLGKRPTFGVDVDILNATGRVVGFPYLIQHASGRVHVGDGFTDVLNVTTHDGQSTASATGRMKYADLTGRFVPLDMNLRISVHNMPTTDELLAALPPDSTPASESWKFPEHSVAKAGSSPLRHQIGKRVHAAPKAARPSHSGRSRLGNSRRNSLACRRAFLGFVGQRRLAPDQ